MMGFKIAFLFLTLFETNHERGWNNFFKNQEKFCSVHVPKKGLVGSAAKSSITIPSSWEHMVRMANNLLQDALNDSSVEKIVFASEASVPGKSFSEIYEDIIANKQGVFSYTPNRDVRQGAEGVQWVVLDKKNAELMLDNENHLRVMLQPQKKPSPASFLNFSNLLKKTIESLNQMDFHDPIIPEPKPTMLPQMPKISKIETLITAPKFFEEESEEEKPVIDLKTYSVNFDTSMGKHDPYMHPFYEKCLNHCFDFWNQAVCPEQPKVFYKFLKDLYEQNKLSKIKIGETYRIPPIFHQIWIGPRPFPAKYKKWQKTWQTMPGWKYKLWTDKDLEDFPFVNRDLFLKEKNMGARADILRMEILYQEGGVYIDTDFECLKPEVFDILNRAYDFYTGITPLDGEIYYLANGLIASIPGHPILKGFIENRRKAKTPKGCGKCTAITLKGPGLFTKMAYEYANKGYRDILLPPTFVYPLAIYPPKAKGHLSSKQGYLAHLMNTEEGREEIKESVVRPESIAIHWWEGAWVLQDGAEIR